MLKFSFDLSTEQEYYFMKVNSVIWIELNCTVVFSFLRVSIYKLVEGLAFQGGKSTKKFLQVSFEMRLTF